MNTMRILLLGALVSGCETTADVVTQQRSAVEPVLARIAALAPKMRALGEGATAPPQPVPLVLERPGTHDANAMFIYEADLEKPGRATQVQLRTLDSVPLLQCGSLLDSQRLFDTPLAPPPSVAKGWLEACARLEYVLVVRERGYLMPKLALEARHFKPGAYGVRVFAFDLKTGALVGTYDAGVSNTESIQLADDETKPQHLQRLVSNLESNAYDALRAGARKAFPGALP